jgi:hypothetical protein
VSQPDARAAVRVWPDYLARELRLPEGTTVVGAEWDDMRDELLLYVSHPDLPERSMLWRPAPRFHVVIARMAAPGEMAYTYSSKYVEDTMIKKITL